MPGPLSNIGQRSAHNAVLVSAGDPFPFGETIEAEHVDVGIWPLELSRCVPATTNSSPLAPSVFVLTGATLTTIGDVVDVPVPIGDLRRAIVFLRNGFFTALLTRRILQGLRALVCWQ